MFFVGNVSGGNDTVPENLKICTGTVGSCTSDQIAELNPTSTHFLKQASQVTSNTNLVLNISSLHFSNPPPVLPCFWLCTEAVPNDEQRRLFQQSH
jgi:hypothetical protein